MEGKKYAIDFLMSDNSTKSVEFEVPQSDISQCLLRDGSLAMKGDLFMNGFKVTGLGTPANDGDTVPLGYANQNFAPAGYGLGSAELISIDIDNITAPGWYCWNYTMSIAGITANYWFMRVDAYGAGASHCVQHIYPCVSNYQIVEIVRRKYAGDWEVSEIINPPMQLNTEYCTSERWNGKHVYVKRISFGSLPSAGSSNVSTGISGGTPVSLTGTFFDGSGNAEPYPVMAGTGTKCLCWLSSDCGKLYVQSIADCSAYTGEFVVKYTKE